MNVSLEKGDGGGLSPTYIEANAKLEQRKRKMFLMKIFMMQQLLVKDAGSHQQLNETEIHSCLENQFEDSNVNFRLLPP